MNPNYPEGVTESDIDRIGEPLEAGEETYCPNCVLSESAEMLEKFGYEKKYCNKVCFAEDNPDFNNNEER